MRLIDADALKNEFPKDSDWEYPVNTNGYVCEMIEAQPTIEARKKGRWIKVDNGYSYWYECSECGCEPLRSKWNGQEVFSDFCPNCGADMRGEKEEE